VITTKITKNTEGAGMEFDRLSHRVILETVGLLINFNVKRLRTGIKRMVL
jgi:hypothetical protein